MDSSPVGGSWRSRCPLDTFVCWGAPPQWRIIQCRHEPDAIKRQVRDRGNSVAAVKTLAADIVDLVKVRTDR